jgi:hypothetical protein
LFIHAGKAFQNDIAFLLNFTKGFDKPLVACAQIQAQPGGIVPHAVFRRMGQLCREKDASAVFRHKGGVK